MILMIEALEKGKIPNVNDFGGLSAIINNVDEVVDAGLQDEFLKTALAEFANRRAMLEEFSAAVAIRRSDDIAIREVVDAMTPFFPFSQRRSSSIIGCPLLLIRH